MEKPGIHSFLSTFDGQDHTVVELVTDHAPLCDNFHPQKYLGIGYQEEMIQAAKVKFSQYEFKVLQEPFLAPLYIVKMPSFSQINDFEQNLEKVRGEKCVVIRELLENEVEETCPLYLVQALRRHDFVLEGIDKKMEHKKGSIYYTFRKCLKKTYDS